MPQHPSEAKTMVEFPEGTYVDLGITYNSSVGSNRGSWRCEAETLPSVQPCKL